LQASNQLSKPKIDCGITIKGLLLLLNGGFPYAGIGISLPFGTEVQFGRILKKFAQTKVCANWVK
jgi:hypothetical protein